MTEESGQVHLTQVEAIGVSTVPRRKKIEMTLRQRQDRPATTYLNTVLIRLYRELWIGGNATSSSQMLCDVTSIPRDLRAKLMDQLLAEHYVTREGDHVRITPAGTKIATSSV